MRRNVRLHLQIGIVVSCLLWAVFSSRPALASTMTAFSDPVAFANAVQIVSTETFDEFQSDTVIGIGTMTIDGIIYTSLNPSALWFVSDTFVAPSPPNSLVTMNVVAPVTLTFGGSGYTDAVGFFLVGVGGIPIPTYRIDVTSVDATLLTETLFPGATTHSIFRGFLSEGGISSVTISPGEVGGTGSNFQLDDVSRGVISAVAVPEPSTGAMTGTIFLIALGYLSIVRPRHTGAELPQLIQPVP